MSQPSITRQQLKMIKEALEGNMTSPEDARITLGDQIYSNPKIVSDPEGRPFLLLEDSQGRPVAIAVEGFSQNKAGQWLQNVAEFAQRAGNALFGRAGDLAQSYNIRL